MEIADINTKTTGTSYLDSCKLLNRCLKLS